MRNRIHFIWLALLLGVAGANAKEAYAFYMESDHSLNFCYDDSKASIAQSYTIYDLNTGSNTPAWSNIASQIEELYFYTSFADYKPTSCYKWADGMANLTRVRNISNLITSSVTRMDYMFHNCTKLTSLDLNTFNTQNVTSMRAMFSGCSSLISLNVSNWSNNRVSDMTLMFENCTSLTSLNLTNFRTTSVIDMSCMFLNCKKLTSLNVSGFETYNVSNFYRMFDSCSSLTSLNVKNFDASNVTLDTGFRFMFWGLSSLRSLTLSNSLAGKGSLFDDNVCKNTGTVSSPCTLNYPTSCHLTFTTITPDYEMWKGGYFKSSNMHAYAVLNGSTLTFWYDDWFTTTGTNYNLNSGNSEPGWHTKASSVTKVVFNSTFQNARPTSCYKWFDSMTNLTSITGMESHLNTSKVTNMKYMFGHCSSLTSVDVSGFKTSEVTDMEGMFSGCSKLSTFMGQTYFVMLNVTNATRMFYNCSSLTSFDLNSFMSMKDLYMPNTSEMMSGCTALKTLYLPSSADKLAFDACKGIGNSSSPCKLVYYYESYLSIESSGSDWFKWKNGYFYTGEAEEYAFLSTDGKTLTFYYDKNRYTRTGGKAYYIINEPDSKPEWYSKTNGVTKVVFNSSYANARPNSCCSWFDGMTNLSSITGLNYLNTSNVMSMDHMFYNCSKLTTLDLRTFNTSNVELFDYMFAGCSGLSSINVSSFNTRALYTSSSEDSGMIGMFQDCSSLTSLDISNFHFFDRWMFGFAEYYEYLYQGKDMFKNCTSLKTLTVPKKADIHPNACSGVGTKTNPCTLVYPVDFTPEIETTGSGWFQWKKGYFCTGAAEAYAFLSTDGKTLTFYYDKNRFTRTGGAAYRVDLDDHFEPSWNSDASNVTNVVFHSSFANAKPSCCQFWFEDMSNLTTITGLNYLDTYETGSMDNMFKNCTKLTSIDLSQLNTYNLATMNDMFAGCTSLKSVKLNGPGRILDGDMVSSSLSGVFDGCSSLTSLDLSDFYFAEPYTYTYGDTSYEAYTITKKAGNNMLRGCTSLQELVLPATANNLSDDACSGVGTKTSPCTLVYPSGFTPDKGSSGNGWYQWKGGYFCDPAVGIPFADNTVKGICLDNWDTNGDGQLTKAEAAAVTSVGTVFKAASITTFDEFKYFTGVETISEGAFSKSTLTAITLPSSVKTIGKDAFLACKSLKSITIPAKVTTIGQNALSYCTAMTSITVASDNTAFASVSGVLFTKSRKTLLQFPAAKSTTYSVPSRTTTIGRDAFFMSSLKSVTLPSSLMELAYDAFGYCKSLTSVELPEGLTTIGDYAFDGCSGLKTLRLPSTVTSIGSYMCNNCKAITDIYNASTTPFAIADNNFTSTTYSNATLHVPAGRKATYAALGGWKEFTKVVDDLPGGILGDSNGDGTVSVNDVQMIVEYVLGNNPSGIILANCDVNGDNVITITDATTIVNIVLTGVQAMPPKARESLTDMVALTAKGSHCSLHLDSSEPYHAFQLEVVLPEGGSMGNVMLAQGRANGHHAEWNEVMPGRYNVIVYSFNGTALRDGSSTALLHFDIANCKADDVSVEGIQMVDGWCKTVLLPSTSGIATGIAWVVDDASEGSSSPYYNTVGIGSNTQQRGINIKDGRKMVKK